MKKKIGILIFIVVLFSVSFNFYSRLNQQDIILHSLIDALDLNVLQSCGVVTNGNGWGSCVVIAPDTILTARHVLGRVGAWAEINGVQYKILSEWKDEVYDVGFIKIEGVLPFVRLGNMPELLQKVFLVGSPYSRSFDQTITHGIISKLNVDYNIWKNLIQTDSEGAPGSSGCPLFNNKEELIGICVAGPNSGGGVTLCVSIIQIKEAFERYKESQR